MGGARTHAKSIVFVSEYTTNPGSKNITLLKDVGMIVPKSRETSAVYMQQDRG